MKLRSCEAFKTFVFTRADKQAVLRGQPLDGRKMNQCVLADRAGVSPAFIAHLASGYRDTCKPETAKAIADALGVNLLVLFEPKMSSATGKSPLKLAS